MIGGVWVGCGWALAQPAPADLASLQKTAEMKTAEWDALAKTLESRLVRMLPCDARVRSSIDEVDRASDARITAVSQYLQAAAAQSRADAQLVAQAIAMQEAAAHEVEIDRAEAEQERIAIDAQLGDLAESLKRRASLSEAHKSLAGIAEMVRMRTVSAEQAAQQRIALMGALRDLAAAYDAREKGIQTEIAALNTESSRWKDYYAARIARAQTECAITNQGPDRQPRRKKR
jgi:hypothetical protein